MSFFDMTKDNGIAVLTIDRAKVNALNEPLVEEFHVRLGELEKDDTVKAIILTGNGKFFTFGFDIPEFMGYTKKAFIGYLKKFTTLYTYIFQFPKPVVAALNGHTIAGGAMLAVACDYRLMVTGKAKISFNEITFGASLFAGSVEMLRSVVGSRISEKIAFEGGMYSAEEAEQMGLVDKVTSGDSLLYESIKMANEYAQKDSVAFASIKKLLRKPIAEQMMKSESDSIQEFTDIWYSPEMRKRLQKIKILN